MYLQYHYHKQQLLAGIIITNADIFILFVYHFGRYRPMSLRIKLANINMMLNYETTFKEYSKLYSTYAIILIGKLYNNK